MQKARAYFHCTDSQWGSSNTSQVKLDRSEQVLKQLSAEFTGRYLMNKFKWI